LFYLQKGMWVLGKDPKTGKIPRWSHVVWLGFHLPTQLYTFVHHHILGHMFLVSANHELTAESTVFMIR
jgi:hypothetical protein